MSLEEQIELFTQNLVTKNNLPSWFHRTIKDLISKNVTIEEWNTFTQYISNNASDIKSIEEFVLALADYIEGYCSKDYVDEQCADTLESAKSYAKSLIPHLYQHNIVGMTTSTENFVLFSFINTTSAEMTFDEVREWIYNNGFTGEGNNSKRYLSATGRCSEDSFEFDYTPPDQSTTNDYCESVVVGVRATNEADNEIKILVSKLKEYSSGVDTYEEDSISMSDSFTDTVVTLC